MLWQQSGSRRDSVRRLLPRWRGVLAEAAPILDERARRVLAGAGARQLGRGGIKLVAAAMGASADTVGKGVAELEAGLVADGRVRVT